MAEVELGCSVKCDILVKSEIIHVLMKIFLVVGLTCSVLVI